MVVEVLVVEVRRVLNADSDDSNSLLALSVCNSFEINEG